MARAIAPDERIALGVETSYDGSGIRAARQDNSALGREARATTQTLAAGAAQGAAAEKGLAAAARQASDEQTKLTLTTEQTRAVVAKSGGDFDRLKQLLREQVETQRQLEQATTATTAAQAQQNQTAAAAPMAGSGGAAASVRRVADEVDRISPKARTAANALSMMAFSIQQSANSTQGLAIAAGSAASGLAGLTTSARLAAAASGIGALVTIFGTVLLLMNKVEQKSKDAGEAIKRSLGDMSDQAVETKFRLLDAAYTAKQQEIATKGQFQIGRENLNRLPGESAQGDLEKLEAQRSAVIAEMFQRRRDKNKEAAKDADEQRKEDAKRAVTLEEELSDEILRLHLERRDDKEGIDNLSADRDFQRRRAEIAALLISEEEKTRLLGEAYKARMDQQDKFAIEASKRRSDIADKELKEQQQRSERGLEIVRNQMESALHAAIIGRESYIQAVTGMLLTPLVRYLEAQAVRHAVEGSLDALFGIWPLAARHFAASAGALAGAAAVARMGGLTSGGGGGGGGGGAGGPAFGTNDPREAGGNITLIVQTIDPRSSAVIEETSWQLQRAGVLKKPVYGNN